MANIERWCPFYEGHDRDRLPARYIDHEVYPGLHLWDGTPAGSDHPAVQADLRSQAGETAAWWHQVRGWIVDHGRSTDTTEIVSALPGYAPSLTAAEAAGDARLRQKFLHPPEACANPRLVPDGTLVRLWFHALPGAPRWRLSTVRRLDALQSHWGSARSFGQLFLDGLRGARHVRGARTEAQEIHEWATLNSLVQGRTYLFVVGSVGPQCMLAQDPHAVVPTVWYAGHCVYDEDQDAVIASAHDLEAHPRLWRPNAARDPVPVLPPVQDADADADADANWGARLLSPDWDPTRTFIGILFPTGVRVTCARYDRAQALRDNDPHLYRRYLQLVGQGDGARVAQFLDAFPWLHEGRRRNYAVRMERGRRAVLDRLLSLHTSLGGYSWSDPELDLMCGAETMEWIQGEAVGGWLPLAVSRSGCDRETLYQEWANLVSGSSAAVQFDMFQNGDSDVTI